MKNVIKAALTCAYVVMVSAPLFAQSILPQPDASSQRKDGVFGPSDLQGRTFLQERDGTKRARPTSS